MGSGAVPVRDPVVSFGSYTLDTSRRTLTKSGIRLKIQRQPLQILELLIRHAPAVVSREEIRQALWGDDLNVDTEQNINFCIRQIRSVLSDSAAKPRFIETLPREGYRFIAQIEGLPDKLEETAPDVEPEAGQAEGDLPKPPPRVVSLKPWIRAGIAALALLLIAGLSLWRALSTKVPAVTELSVVTDYVGDERDPSFSPDGRQVAYSWDGGKGENRDIYITLVGEQHAVRLTDDPALDAFPAWSPNGKEIAFVRFRNEIEADVLSVSPLGGAERNLQRVRLGYHISGSRYEISGSHRMLAWSPDGNYLAFTTEVNRSGHYTLFLLSLSTGEVRPLISNPEGGIGDTSPAFSPDGRWLAYAHLDQPHNSRIFLQRLTNEYRPDGVPQRVADAGVFPQTPVWLEDSKSFLFLDTSRILRAEFGGKAKLVYVSDFRLDGLTIAGSSAGGSEVRRLVSARSEEDDDLRMLRFHPGSLVPSGPPEPVVQSTASETYPRFSPDGRQMAFLRRRNGQINLWLADPDGGNPRQLTHLSATSAGNPAWAPNNQYLTFFARVPKDPEIYVVHVPDGTSQQLTHGKFQNWTPSWSEDGRTLYFSRWMQPGGSRIFSLPPNGGAAQALWDGPGIYPFEVPGRHLLVYGKFDQRGLFARSLIGDPSKNPEMRLANDYFPPMGGLAPVYDGVYYAGFSVDGIPRAFRFYSFDKRESVDIAPAPPNLQLGLAISPDRSRLIYAVEKHGGQDLVQLELR